MNSPKIKYRNFPEIKEFSCTLRICVISILLILLLNHITLLHAIPIGDQTKGEDIEGEDTFRTRKVGTWESLSLWSESKELNAVAVGDVDPEHAGSEIVVGGNSNKLRLIHGFGSTWKTETIFEDDWYITSIAIGDVYPPHPGNEIVVVGWSTNVTLLYKSEQTNKWVKTVLYNDYDWLYDVTIGDIDPTNDGDEIVFVGDPRHVMMLYYSNEQQKWMDKVLWDNTPDINVVAIGDFNRTHPGNELAVSGVNVKEIKLREILYDQNLEKWVVNIISEIEKDPLEIVIDDFYSGNSGSELAIISIQRNVLMVYLDEHLEEWTSKKIWQDIESIRDLEVYDIIPEHEGNELIAVGYSNIATVIFENAEKTSGWETRSIFIGDSNLNGLAIGEFDLFNRGQEIVILKSVGKVIKLHYEDFGFNLVSLKSKFEITTGVNHVLPVITTSSGGFSGKVNLSINNYEDLSIDGVNISIMENLKSPPAIFEIQINITEFSLFRKYNLVLLGKANVENVPDVYLNLTLSSLPESTKDFNIDIEPKKVSIIADFSANFLVELNSINNWNEEVSLNIEYLPKGVSYHLSNNFITSEASVQLNISTTSTTPMDRYFIIIDGHSKGEDQLLHSSILLLDVTEPGPDFEITIDPIDAVVRINDTVKFTINGFSLLGFDESISFTIDGLPTSISRNFEPRSFVPTGNTTLSITPKPDTELGDYNITITGISETKGIQRTILFNLHVELESPKYNTTIEPSGKLTVSVGETASFKIRFTPIANFEDNISIDIQNLKEGMLWNNEVSPVFINNTKPVFINITGLSEPGEFILRLTTMSENFSIEDELVIVIIPQKDPKKDESIFDFNNELFQVMFWSAVVLIALLILSKFLSHSPECKSRSESEEERGEIIDREKNKKPIRRKMNKDR